MNSNIRERMAFSDLFEVECRDKYGNLKWRDTIKNLVVDEGLNDVLDKYLKGSAYTAAHVVGLTDGTPTVAAGDTLASHTGWVEVTAYSEGARQTATWGTVSGKSVDNSAAKAVFTINANATEIGGCFICTAIILYGGGAFTAGNKTLDNGDVLNVSVTATAAAS